MLFKPGPVQPDIVQSASAWRLNYVRHVTSAFKFVTMGQDENGDFCSPLAKLFEYRHKVPAREVEMRGNQ